MLKSMQELKSGLDDKVNETELSLFKNSYLL